MKKLIVFLIVNCTLLIVNCRINAQEIGSPKDIPKGYMLIEGDIIVPVDFYEKANWRVNMYWTKVGNIYTIPYDFDANVNATNKQRSINAMTEWENVANVNFVVRNGEANYIRFRDSDGNSSQVGMVGGMQYLNMANWDWHFKICHELCHALGFWHEHSRPDRDTYVTINWNCIDTKPDNYSHNFDRHDDAGYYGPYDLMSVMHYPGWAFYDAGDNAACNGNGMTIQVKAPYTAYQDSIGQRGYLTFWDKRMMSFIYSYSNWRFVDGFGSNLFQTGSFEVPYKTFDAGYNDTPANGTLWIKHGSYNVANDVTLDKEMSIEAAWEDVELF